MAISDFANDPDTRVLIEISMKFRVDNDAELWPLEEDGLFIVQEDDVSVIEFE
jgi:hypothetical protein